MSAAAVKRAWLQWSLHFHKSIKDMTTNEASALLLSYIENLQDIPDEIMDATALQCLAHYDWLPTVHQVREEAVRLVQPSKRTAAEAWVIVQRTLKQRDVAQDWQAAARGNAPASSPFKDSIIRATVEVIGLKRLRFHDESDEATLFAQFRDTYNTLQTRQREALITPPRVHQILNGIAERKRIEGQHADLKQISDKSRT
jgi:hypothetical protein